MLLTRSLYSKLINSVDIHLKITLYLFTKTIINILFLFGKKSWHITFRKKITVDKQIVYDLKNNLVHSYNLFCNNNIIIEK